VPPSCKDEIVEFNIAIPFYNDKIVEFDIVILFWKDKIGEFMIEFPNLKSATG
jgi:hypothetical protein